MANNMVNYMYNPTFFEWDDSKNRENIDKHGVSFEEAQMAFADSKLLIKTDPIHSILEQRFFCYGLVNGKVLTVRFTPRNGKIRIIGAGNWRGGRKIYETYRR